MLRENNVGNVCCRYRENNVTHQSVLSSLSASYNGIGELSYYEDLAKNIDANLAEVDMESFRAEDINLFLSTIPSFCKANAKKRHDKELDNSICKSKQLFSPVKESILSVDSLDMDCYAEDCDMIITCQANKNNYTIAFEGSTIYSDDSFYGMSIQLLNPVGCEISYSNFLCSRCKCTEKINRRYKNWSNY